MRLGKLPSLAQTIAMAASSAAVQGPTAGGPLRTHAGGPCARARRAGTHGSGTWPGALGPWEGALLRLPQRGGCVGGAAWARSAGTKWVQRDTAPILHVRQTPHTALRQKTTNWGHHAQGTHTCQTDMHVVELASLRGASLPRTERCGHPPVQRGNPRLAPHRIRTEPRTSVSARGAAELARTLRDVGVKLSKPELHLDPKPLLRLILSRFFGNASGFVDMVATWVPSPVAAARGKEEAGAARRVAAQELLLRSFLTRTRFRRF